MHILIENICPASEDFPYVSVSIVLQDIIDFPDSVSPSIAVNVLLENSDYSLSEIRRRALVETRALLQSAADGLSSGIR